MTSITNSFTRARYLIHSNRYLRVFDVGRDGGERTDAELHQVRSKGQVEIGQLETILAAITTYEGHPIIDDLQLDMFMYR